MNNINNSKWLILSICLLTITSWVNASTPPNGSQDIKRKIDPTTFSKLESKINQQGTARIIVKLESDDEPFAKLGASQAQSPVAHAKRQDAIRRLQERVLPKLQLTNPNGLKQFRHVPFLALVVDSRELNQLTNLPEVANIRGDEKFYPVLDFSAPQIGADVVWNNGFSGSGEVIAILDTGTDTSHNAFAWKIVAEACFSTTYEPDNASSLCPAGSNPTGADEQIGSGAGVNCDLSIAPTCDHGTHVAGIAASGDMEITGIARDAQLIPVQVFSVIEECILSFCLPAIAGYESDLTRALEWIYDQRNNFNIAAVNLSLGGDRFATAEECESADIDFVFGAIENLRAAGIATVAASGNDGVADRIASPACFSNTFSVGAVNDIDNVASFSNSSSLLDVLAPGQGIKSTVPGEGFVAYDGTSMATPHMAGAFAVLSSVNPEATVDEIFLAISSTGIPITDSRNGVTAPRVQLDAASNALIDSSVDLKIQTSHLPVGFVDVPYYASLVASGGTGLPPYVWSVIDGSLPDGLALDSGSGEIIGTPISVGVTPFSIQVDDSVSVSEKDLEINILAPPVTIVNLDLPYGIIGTSYSQTFTAVGGTPPYSWSISSGSLPTGLSMSSTGLISGTPGEQGSSSFVVQVADNDGGINSQAYNLRIYGDVIPLIINQVDPGEYGFNYGTNLHNLGLIATFTGTGVDLALSVTGYDIDFDDELAVYLNSSLIGYLSVGPNENLNAGDTLVLEASSQLEGEENQILFENSTVGYIWGVTNILISDELHIVSKTLEQAVVGEFYSETLSAIGGGAAYTWSLTSGSLPPGLSLNSDGEISGFPTNPGVYTFNVNVTDGVGGNDTKSLSITVTDGSGGAPNVVLTLDVEDIGAYGKNYGSDEHETELTVTFEGTGSDRKLFVYGYDIDYIDEVEVHLNGTFLRNLSIGPGDDLNLGDTIFLPAGMQNLGENLILFKQKTVGYTWGVTGLLLTEYNGLMEGYDVFLTLGSEDNTAYGHNYGAEDYGIELLAVFNGTATDLELDVTGYDIDFVDEQAVFLNGIFIGYLDVGPDNDLNSGNKFTLPASMQLSGQNQLVFENSTVGYTWGVTNMLLLQAGSLQIESEDLANAVVDISYSETLTAVGGSPSSYTWSLESGSLPPGLSLSPGGEISGTPTDPGVYSFVVKVIDGSGGENTKLLSITVIDGDGTFPVILEIGLQDAGEYGYNYGSNQHETELYAFFESTGDNLVLNVTGYDIDYADEVEVFLNDLFIGYLKIGPNNGLNSGDTMFLPSSLMYSPGQLNQLKFKEKTAGYAWGVTGLLLTVHNDSGWVGEAGNDILLDVNVEDNNSYGHNYGIEHGSQLFVGIDGAGSDLKINVTGYDIDYVDEVAVYFNGIFLKHLTKGPNNGLNTGEIIFVPSGLQLPGNNQLEFRNKDPSWLWGVTNLLLNLYDGNGLFSEPNDISLDVNVEDNNSYGHKYGIEYGTQLFVGFNGTGTDLTLNVTGYDIDFVDEVAVYLNGKFLGYLTPGPNNGLNQGDTIELSAGIQLLGENQLLFKNRNAKWLWGVTDLLITDGS